MRKTGELLKKSREASGFTLSEVALATKINPKILTAIENGDDANLPAKTFLKGFVRSYALFLKLDAEEVIAVYNSETGTMAPERVHEAYKTPEPTTPPATNRRSVDEENSSAMRTGAVIVIVVLIGLIIGVRELIEKYQRERVMPTNEVKVIPLLPQMAEPTGTSPAKVTQAPNPEPKELKESSKTEVEETAAPAPENQHLGPVRAAKPSVSPPVAVASPLPITGAPGVTVVKPVAEEPPAKSKAVEAKVQPPAEPARTKEPALQKETAKVEEVPKAEAKAEISKIVHSEIIIEALDNVELKFRVHGQSKRVSLAPTEVHTILSDEPLDLEVSDGGAVNLIVNGRDRGPIGELGKAKQVQIP